MNLPPTIACDDVGTTGVSVVLRSDSTAVSCGVFRTTTGVSTNLGPPQRPKREPPPPREQQREYLRRQRAQSRSGR